MKYTRKRIKKGKRKRKEEEEESLEMREEPITCDNVSGVSVHEKPESTAPARVTTSQTKITTTTKQPFFVFPLTICGPFYTTKIKNLPFFSFLIPISSSKFKIMHPNIQ